MSDNKTKKRRRNRVYWFVVKTTVLMTFITFVNATKVAIEPTITNMLAVDQLKSDNYSYAIYTYYSYFKNYGWLLYLFIFALFYSKDIIDLVKYVIKAEKGE